MRASQHIPQKASKSRLGTRFSPAWDAPYLPHLLMFLLNSLHICLSIFISEIQVSYQGHPFPLAQRARLMAIYHLQSHFNVHGTLREQSMTPADLRFYTVHQRKFDLMLPLLCLISEVFAFRVHGTNLTRQ